MKQSAEDASKVKYITFWWLFLSMAHVYSYKTACCLIYCPFHLLSTSVLTGNSTRYFCNKYLQKIPNTSRAPNYKLFYRMHKSCNKCPSRRYFLLLLRPTGLKGFFYFLQRDISKDAAIFSHYTWLYLLFLRSVERKECIFLVEII